MRTWQNCSDFSFPTSNEIVKRTWRPECLQDILPVHSYLFCWQKKKIDGNYFVSAAQKQNMRFLVQLQIPQPTLGHFFLQKISHFHEHLCLQSFLLLLSYKVSVICFHQERVVVFQLQSNVAVQRGACGCLLETTAFLWGPGRILVLTRKFLLMYCIQSISLFFFFFSPHIYYFSVQNARALTLHIVLQSFIDTGVVHRVWIIFWSLWITAPILPYVCPI